MNIRKVIGSTAVGTIIGIAAVSGVASANVPSFSSSCASITVSGVKYGQGGTVKMEFGSAQRSETFGGPTFSYTLASPDQTKDEKYEVVVDSNAKDGDHKYEGVVKACQAVPTTAAVTTTTVQDTTTTQPADTTTIPTSTGVTTTTVLSGEASTIPSDEPTPPPPGVPTKPTIFNGNPAIVKDDCTGFIFTTEIVMHVIVTRDGAVYFEQDVAAGFKYGIDYDANDRHIWTVSEPATQFSHTFTSDACSRPAVVPASPSAAGPQTLPTTGADVTTQLAVALALLAIGITLCTLNRRRHSLDA